MAASLARQKGRPHYVVAAVDPETGEGLPSIVDVEPCVDHVRVEPTGAAVLVYWPTQTT